MKTDNKFYITWFLIGIIFVIVYRNTITSAVLTKNDNKFTELFYAQQKLNNLIVDYLIQLEDLVKYNAAQQQLKIQQEEMRIFEEKNCLGKNLFYEARNQDIPGMIAVVQVVHYRLQSRKHENSICDVVYAPSQFSWTKDKNIIKPELELTAWEKSLVLSDQYLSGELYKQFDPELENATMYHADYVTPPWDYSKLVFIKQIGNHKFYREID